MRSNKALQPDGLLRRPRLSLVVMRNTHSYEIRK